jgi:hypothetical protein
MARVIKIPVSFEFRTAKVEWVEARARIVGWWKQDDGTIDRDGLIARITEGNAGLIGRIVNFRTIHLPFEQWAQCRDESSVHADNDEKDRAVERVCSILSPCVFVSSSRIPLEPFDLKMTSPADAWQMREDFLRMTPDNSGAMRFLNKWGSWSYEDHVELSELLEMQRSVRTALISSSPGTWFAGGFSSLPISPFQTTEYPYFTASTIQCQDAIRMTVTIDLLLRLRFKACARRDCAMPFAIKSKHKRKYCTQYCGHLVSVRRNRKAETRNLNARKRNS